MLIYFIDVLGPINAFPESLESNEQALYLAPHIKTRRQLLTSGFSSLTLVI